MDNVNLLLDFFPSPKYVPIVWGIQHGIFAKYGINLTLTPGEGSRFSLPEVNANKVQFALGDIDTYLAEACQSGANSLSIENYEPVATTGIVSHTPITDLHQLIGKTFATVADSSGIAALKYTLAQNGIDPSKVHIELVQFSVLYSQFFQGKFYSAEMDLPGDEATLDQAHRLGEPAYQVSLAKFGLLDDSTTMVASNAIIRSNPDLVRRMATAMYESQIQAAATANDSDVLKDYQKLDPTKAAADVLAGWADYKKVVMNPGPFDLAQVQKIRTRVLSELGIQSASCTAQQSFSNKYLPASAQP
jgi:NitT/TauT family transport system substrate-binding protein